jgi:hypothetical protein
MSWSSALLALLISHVVGDVMLQTEWQAATKTAGLRVREGRRALLLHVASYMVAFLPALAWVAAQTSAWRAVLVGALVAAPHLLIDDGTLVRLWIREVKLASSPTQALTIAVDQCFHLVCLLGAALVAAA